VACMARSASAMTLGFGGLGFPVVVVVQNRSDCEDNMFFIIIDGTAALIPPCFTPRFDAGSMIVSLI